MLSCKSSSHVLFILMAQKFLLIITYQNKHLNQQQDCTEYCNMLHPLRVCAQPWVLSP